MTEQQYIDSTDRVRINYALAILRSIVPENSSVIKSEELGNMIKTLANWEIDLFKVIVIGG